MDRGAPVGGPRQGKDRRAAEERDRHLSEEEIVELARRLPEAGLLRTAGLSVWIMLGTCSRVGELSQARWKHVDLEAGEWSIPAGNSKNARGHAVFLSDFALERFRELHALTGPSGWCLPSRGDSDRVCLKSISKQIKDRMRTQPLTNRSQATGALLLAGGPWAPHDPRRTGATTMGELGVAGEVNERCLNHAEPTRLRRTYQRHEPRAEQRDAWRRLGDRAGRADRSAPGTQANSRSTGSSR